MMDFHIPLIHLVWPSEIAGSYAVRQGVAQAQPCILEPWHMLVEVTVPDNYTGEVIGDLNTKRTRILGTSPLGGNAAVQADIPQSEMLRYATELRSLTHGRGFFSMEFQRYDPLPAHLTQRVTDGAKKRLITPTYPGINYFSLICLENGVLAYRLTEIWVSALQPSTSTLFRIVFLSYPACCIICYSYCSDKVINSK
jgi:hypothetical protein